MNTDDVLRLIREREFGRINSAWHKTTFACWRDTKGGGAEEVTIDVLDRGTEEPKRRFMCIAKLADGRACQSNPEASIDVALSTMHWGELDQPRPRPFPKGKRAILVLPKRDRPRARRKKKK